MSGDNIASLAAARSKKQDPKPPTTDDRRPVVQLVAGEIHRNIDEAEAALLQVDPELYKQGERVVHIVWDKTKVSGGGEGNVLRITEVTGPHMVERFTAAARFEKWDKRSEDWVACNCPPNLAEMYLHRYGRGWGLPFLLGITTTPTLKPDGTILDSPGYDPGTGILFNPLGIAFPKVKDRPDRADALAALELLKRPLAEFPFMNEASKAVALSGILTAVIRRSLPTAPMHAFSAPTAGSGKSLLVDIASMVATGERASVTSTGGGKDDTELEKRLAASMLAGDTILSIDNVEQPLSGDFLCQILTQPSTKIRVLGSSKNVETPIITSFFATGNNLAVAGDLTRRVLVGKLNVDEERPELRSFTFHPLELVKTYRPDFVHAALTLIRAYVVADDKVSTVPLGSFEEWSRTVRDALVWAGEADPVEVIEEVRRGDPRLQRLKQMMDAWWTCFGDRPVRMREVVAAAAATDPENGELSNPDLREAVMGALGGDHHLNAEKIGWWLRKNAGRVIGGRRFARFDAGSRPNWQLVDSSSPTADESGLLGFIPP